MPNPHVKSTTFSQPLNNEALKRATISGVHCSIEREVGYIHNSDNSGILSLAFFRHSIWRMANSLSNGRFRNSFSLNLSVS